MNGPRRAPVLVAAGGTGGHLFPAEALAAELSARGIPVHLLGGRAGPSAGIRTPRDPAHGLRAGHLPRREERSSVGTPYRC